MAKKVVSEGALGGLLEGDSLRSAFRRRRDEFEYAKVSPKDEKGLAEGGWSVHKRTQSSLWMRKAKSPEGLLEDRVWCLLYRMG
jgi:hypothetical protein